MKPGRELDTLVAEKVMGITPTDYTYSVEEIIAMYQPGSILCIKPKLSNYSTKIEDAWEVVEKLAQDSWRVSTLSSELGGTDCYIECGVGVRGRFSSQEFGTQSKEAPHAICLAALKAVGHKF